MPAVPLSQVAVHLRPEDTSPSPRGRCRKAERPAAEGPSPGRLRAYA